MPPSKLGRPRSDEAHGAVLRAVDDLLVEIGYAQVTMKAIAERAGVSRQTVYRWWSSPAEVLLDASVTDAAHELQVDPASPADMASAFLERLATFLTTSDAGLAYRALLGAAQQDRGVARMMTDARDPLRSAAEPVVNAALGPAATEADLDTAAAALIGPVLFEVLTTGLLGTADLAALADRWIRSHPMRRGAGPQASS